MSDITFAAVTSGKSGPGRKLTKSLFRQIVWEDIFVLDHVKKGRILGWVNYYWRDCYEGRAPYDVERTPSISDGRHILWKTNAGELRRCIVWEREYCPPLLQEALDKLEQLFLGEFFA